MSLNAKDERGSEQQSEDGNKVEDDHDYIEADDYGENIEEDDQPKERNLRNMFTPNWKIETIENG